MLRGFYAALFAALLLTFCQTAPAADKPVVVQDEWVRVKDLFQEKGLPSSLRPFSEKKVCKAPRPGQSQTVSGDHLHRVLARLFQKAKTPPSLGGRITIRRPGQKIPSKKLKSLFLKEASKHFPEKIALEKFRISGARTYALGALSLLPQKERLRIQKGRMKLPVTVIKSKKKAGRINLYAKVLPIREVVVAARTIARGETLSLNHLKLSKRPVSLSESFLAEKEPLVGRQTTVAIDAGTPITQKKTRAPFAVRRKDAVLIRYEKGGLTLTASGVAQEGGALGDVILVQNSRSRKRLSCRITGARQVAPLF